MMWLGRFTKAYIKKASCAGAQVYDVRMENEKHIVRVNQYTKYAAAKRQLSVIFDIVRQRGRVDLQYPSECVIKEFQNGL